MQGLAMSMKPSTVRTYSPTFDILPVRLRSQQLIPISQQGEPVRFVMPSMARQQVIGLVRLLHLITKWTQSQVEETSKTYQDDQKTTDEGTVMTLRRGPDRVSMDVCPGIGVGV